MTSTDRAGHFDAALDELANEELLVATALAARVIVVSDFRQKCELARQLGACGRRIEQLVRSLDDLPPSRPTVPDLDDTTIALLGARYSATVEVLERTGLAAWDARQRLRLATALLPAEALRHVGRHGAQTGERRPAPPCTPPPVRARRVPPTHGIDPRWIVASPGEAVARVTRVEDGGLLHKLHHTSFRETLAVEIAAMNLYEFDGLPWRFFTDMARQAEDESRHAEMCLDRLNELGGGFEDFTLPFAGNYFEMYWEMDLFDRLVAMNLDVESRGNAYLRDLAERAETVDAASGRLFTFVLHDERRHAQIGNRWLRHLVPDVGERKRRIDAARALQVVAVASAHANVTGDLARHRLDEWSSGQPVPTYDRPASSRDEPEVGLRGRSERTAAR